MIPVSHSTSLWISGAFESEMWYFISPAQVFKVIVPKAGGGSRHVGMSDFQIPTASWRCNERLDTESHCSFNLFALDIG